MNLSFDISGIYIAKEPIDFRKGINTLCQYAADQFGINPCDQSLYIFTNRHKDRIKCLFYDGTGFWMFSKILNEGHFDWRMEGDGMVSVTEQQLMWLLNGLCVDTGTVFKKSYPIYV